MVLLICAGVLLFQMFYPYQPAKIHSFTVLNPDRIVPGSIAWVEVRFDKYLPLPAEVTNWLVCGNKVMQIRAERGNNPVGINKTIISPSIIPELTPHDWDDIRRSMGGAAVCTIRGTYNYSVGLMREIPYTKETAPFKVQ
jgi:hypothetical protein